MAMDTNKPAWLEVRRFTGGVLAGLRHERITPDPLPVGFRCDKPFGGTSPYEIIAVRPALPGERR
jgi:hypothetical protein